MGFGLKNGRPDPIAPTIHLMGPSRTNLTWDVLLDLGLGRERALGES